MQSPEAAERGRSAFAAAFFSALQPGLGHAYAGAWGRALAWFAPSLLIYAFALGSIRADGLAVFGARFGQPDFLLGVLLFLVLDVAYRGIAAVDAFRLANRPSGRRAAGSAVTGAGLLSVLFVLLFSHVAVGQTVNNIRNGILKVGGGDQTAIQTPGPSSGVVNPGSELPATPTPADETQGPAATPTPTQAPSSITGRFNVLLIGRDSGRSGVQTEGNTDTLIVMSIDAPTGRVALVSLPRDTVGVPLPREWPAFNAYGGFYGGKINTLYLAARSRADLFPGNNAVRGYNAVKGALGELYGIEIPYYVEVDLSGFRDVINTLGGVVVDVQVPVYDDRYPANAGQGSTKLYIPPGIQFMDGTTALAYARARHATNDFDRAVRQQNVITSVREQTDISTLLQPGVVTALFNELTDSVKTDIPPSLFPDLVGLAQRVDFNRRISLVLGPPTFGTECYLPNGLTGPGCPNSNLYSLRANVPAIHKAVQGVFSQDPAITLRLQKITAEAAAVNVLNGTTGTNGVSTRVAENLATYGINATVPPVNGGKADRSNYTSTVITVWNGGSDDLPVTIEWLQKLFGVTVQTADDPNQKADITVVVGTNTTVPPQSP